MLRGLYRLGTFRLRRTKEPPLDKGNIPWLGHAEDFRNNCAEFLLKMQRKHGDIFTVKVRGAYFTFLMDPLSFGSVIKEVPSKLDAKRTLEKIVVRSADYHSISSSHRAMHASTKRRLMGSGLVDCTQAMSVNLQNVMLHGVFSGQRVQSWQQGGLFQFSFSIIFRASYLALFGNESAKKAGSIEKALEMDRIISEELSNEFQRFHHLLPQLIYGMLPPKDILEAKRLKKLLSRKMSAKNQINKDHISGWITDQQTFMAENGMADYMQDRNLFMLLIVSQLNTGPSIFWVLLFLMKDPGALKAVKDEIEQVIKASEQEVKPGGPLLNVTTEMLLETPILNSTLEEALRLVAAPILPRVVLEDMTLKMADGREYAIRKGDRVAMFPYISVQMDPEVHPEPHVFRYNRFLNTDGTRKVDFYKNGKRLKYFTMPFGAGTTICPGRFFALNALKQCVFLMLTYFEFELVNPEEAIPSVDHMQAGLGTMPPNHDILFRYRLRL